MHLGLTTPIVSTERPQLDALPVRLNRRAAAAIVTMLYFPIAPRTLEAWPLSWRHVNGKALCETAELLAEAQRRLSEARAEPHAKRRKVAA